MTRKNTLTEEEIRNKMLLLSDSIVNMLGGAEKARWTVFDADSFIRQEGLELIVGLCGYAIQIFTSADVLNFADLIPARKNGKFVILVRNDEKTNQALFEFNEEDEHSQFVAIHEYVKTYSRVHFKNSLEVIVNNPPLRI